MINVNNVTKRYGKLIANNQINLQVASGELAVLLGPNGAGKSTLIKSICGLLRFDGTITIDGFDNHSVDAKRILGYVPEFPSLYPMLTVYEHLEFIAKAYRLKEWEAYAEELLKKFELDDKQNKLGKELSKGMQQKVSVCCALLPKPKAVIFDEPLVGLDPHGIREIKAMIADLKKSGSAVLVSTHMIDSVQPDWYTTCIIKNGSIAHICHRNDQNGGKTLEETYFSITETEPVKE